MPSLNFDLRFGCKVERGSKLHSIRAKRKHPIKVNDPLYLFTGLRTGNCQRLMNTTCSRIRPIHFTAEGAMRLDGVFVDPEDAERIARNDGFRDFNDLITWLQQRHGLPFDGDLIEWHYRPLKSAKE